MDSDIDSDESEIQSDESQIYITKSRFLLSYNNDPEIFRRMIGMEVTTFDDLFLELYEKLETSMFRTIPSKIRLEAAVM
jgi:hypothetical protein